MKTIGQLIKQARQKRKVSVGRLAQQTKIKPVYILAIENERWQVIPNFATAQGFVRNIAQALGVNPAIAMALLRRDFQEQPKITLSTPRAFWTPKTTIIILLIAFSSFLIVYLVRQYQTFVIPPPLVANAARIGERVEISGQTSKEAQVLINEEAVLVNDDGSFKLEVEVVSGQKLIVKSLSRSGKATEKEIIIP